MVTSSTLSKSHLLSNLPTKQPRIFINFAMAPDSKSNRNQKVHPPTAKSDDTVPTTNVHGINSAQVSEDEITSSLSNASRTIESMTEQTQLDMLHAMSPRVHNMYQSGVTVVPVVATTNPPANINIQTALVAGAGRERVNSKKEDNVTSTTEDQKRQRETTNHKEIETTSAASQATQKRRRTGPSRKDTASADLEEMTSQTDSFTSAELEAMTPEMAYYFLMVKFKPSQGAEANGLDEAKYKYMSDQYVNNNEEYNRVSSLYLNDQQLAIALAENDDAKSVSSANESKKKGKEEKIRNNNSSLQHSRSEDSSDGSYVDSETANEKEETAITDNTRMPVRSSKGRKLGFYDQSKTKKKKSQKV